MNDAIELQQTNKCNAIGHCDVTKNKMFVYLEVWSL